MPTYTVTSAVFDEEIDFGDGKMNKFSLSLQDANGSVTPDVALWLKTTGKYTNPPLEGDTVTCEIVDAPRGGLKAQTLRIVEQSTNGASAAPAPTSSAGFRTDTTGRSIERQVALKCAAEIAAAAKVGDGDKIIALAEKLDSFLSGVTTDQPESSSTSDDDIPF